MKELKRILREKIKLCATGINSTSSSDRDVKSAEAIEHLARALSYINQIKESEDN